MTQFTQTVVIFLLCCCFSASIAQEPTSAQTRKIEKVKSLIDDAGGLFKSKEYSKSASKIRSAKKLMAKLVGYENSKILEQLKGDYTRLSKAQELLADHDQEFAVMSPLSEMGKSVEPEKDPPKKKEPNPDSESEEAISFTRQIAPILVSRCAGCHVRSSKGGFSAKSFETLMKGGKKGKVFKAGHPDKSILFTLTESGKMPPSLSRTPIPAEEIELLKKWITQGAKYDGKKKSDLLLDYVELPKKKSEGRSRNR